MSTKKKGWSKEERTKVQARIVELHKAGMKPADIARETGYSGEGVRTYLRNQGHQTERRLTKKQIAAKRKKIEDLWNQGLEATEIARRVGYTDVGVRNALNQLGYQMRSPEEIGAMKHKLSDEEEREIVRRWESGESSEMLAKEFGVSQPYVYKVADRLKPGRRRGHQRRANPSGSINEESFSDPLSPEAAYWVGVLYADGSIRPSDGSRQDEISLCLATKDRELVERFAAFLGSAHMVHSCKAGIAVRVQVKSDRIASDLSRYNVVPSKQSREVVPDSLASSSPFWLGVIDGDGCVFDYATHSGLHLCGSHDTISGFISFCESLGCRPGKKPNKASSIFQTAFCAKDETPLIARALLGSVPWSLPRKRALLEILATQK